MSDPPRTRVRLPVEPPKPVEVNLWVSAARPDVWFPGLLHEWEGRGPEGRREWKGRCALEVEAPPPSWSEAHPWVPAAQIRER